MNFIAGRIASDNGLRFIARDGEMSIPLTAEQGRRLATFAGKDVTLGVRPEDVYVATGPKPPSASAEATVQLEAVEPMGNEIFLHGRGAEHELTARVAPQVVPEAGQEVRLALDLAKLHFFDGEGRAVGA
jgi:multiple sugar transport system ATP-binding protein